MTEIQRAAQDIAKLVKEHVDEQRREAFMACLHSRLSTAVQYGANWNDVLNEIHKQFGTERRTSQTHSFSFRGKNKGKEICPVCKTAQITYAVVGRPNNLFLVDHEHNGRKCEGSHRRL